MADTAITVRTRWFHAAASLLIGAVSLAVLAVNFLLAVPIGLAGIGCAVVGRRRDAAHRGIHTAALIMCSFAAVAGVLLAVFLLSASSGVSVSSVPAP
ncbi:hypothetical protein ACFVUB_17900 [Streptomyces niveus]|uniref:hypothetical protein n=1 Tax=Streptomyces niveus TaxID=193462 RepID=UPI0036DA8CDC